MLGGTRALPLYFPIETLFFHTRTSILLKLFRNFQTFIIKKIKSFWNSSFIFIFFRILFVYLKHIKKVLLNQYKPQEQFKYRRFCKHVGIISLRYYFILLEPKKYTNTTFQFRDVVEDSKDILACKNLRTEVRTLFFTIYYR